MQVKFLKLGALKLQHIAFSNFMTFSVSTFGLISTAFRYNFNSLVSINATYVVRTARKLL